MSDSFDIDPDLVRKLADLLNETGLGEIEYEDNGKRVRVALPGVGAPAVAAPVVAPAAGVVAVLMAGALAMHVKVGDPPSKSVPATLMLLMSAFVCAIAYL